VFFLFVFIFVIIIVGDIMKDKVILLSGIICYILSFLFIVFYLFMEFSVINLYSPIERLKMLLFVFIFMYLGCYLLYKENRCKKFKLGKFNLWILFILYVVMLLNMALFGMTAKEWRNKNPELNGNIRDHATMNELICLSNLENLNSVFINDGIEQSERLVRLNKIAITQMQTLNDVDIKYLK
jgi:hypothetical protein